MSVKALGMLGIIEGERKRERDTVGRVRERERGGRERDTAGRDYMAGFCSGDI